MPAICNFTKKKILQHVFFKMFFHGYQNYFLTTNWSIYPSIYLASWLSTYQPTYLTTYLPTYLPITVPPSLLPRSIPCYWPTDWLTDQLTDQSTDRPTNQLTDWPTDQLTNQPTNRPTDRPTVWLNNRPTDCSTEQPTNQPANQLINQFTHLSIYIHLYTYILSSFTTGSIVDKSMKQMHMLLEKPGSIVLKDKNTKQKMILVVEKLAITLYGPL